MTVPGNIVPLLMSEEAAAGGYQVSRSLRFNSADSASCSRVFTSTGNRRTWTWAAWIKRSAVSFSAEQHIWGVTGTTDATYGEMFFGTGDTLRFAVGYNTVYGITTTRVFRDPGAWFHVVLAFDATQSTAANKIRLYINGVEETTFSSDTRSSLANQDWGYNNNVAHYIGRNPNSDIRQFNGYLADVHFIDGQALTPSSFAETDATTGQWIPKAYTGSKGTNGFHLEFADNSAATAAALGKDTANSNNWTPNNFSVTAGAGNDSLVDTPTSYGTDTGAGGEVRGNYCTLNPLVNISGHTFSNGNLEVVTSSSNYGTFVSTIAMPSSGKWYAEAYISATSGYPLVGIAGTGCTFGTTSYLGGQATMYAYYGVNGNKYNNGTSSSYGATYTAGDTIGVAYNADAGTITFYKNGVSQGQAYSGITSGSYYFAGNEFNTASGTQIWNFGQRPFAYTAPSGFKALCDTNLTAPVIAKPNTVFDTVLWTGNNTGQTISLPGAFSPDLVWTKVRSAANNHWLFDVIRGADQGLSSSTTTNELTRSSSVTAFGSTGFTLGTSADVNSSAYTYVAWAWDAGTSTVTNNNGSISSQVRANASAGFSIVTYTGNGTAGATIGHGLNVAPQLLINKRRSGTGTTADWAVWHKSVADTSGSSYVLFLNTTDNALSASNRFNSTAPTSTVFTVGNSDATNYNGGTFVTYAFAPVANYSSMGSYVGDGSTSGFGPYIHCGFRPKLILIKSSSVAYSWLMFDSVRNPYNLTTQVLYADSSTAEMTNNGTGSGGYESIDILSNGFQIKSNSSRYNQSGATYIYFAVAESPFQYARAR